MSKDKEPKRQKPKDEEKERLDEIMEGLMKVPVDKTKPKRTPNKDKK